ncbi:MAG: CrcB family protein [Christensenellaceae bacterium]|jgi:CrcB protein|nr:CrcB family protein [Christensenellaceae bacterium]
MQSLLCAGFGGFIGACLRFVTTKALLRLAPAFPYGTLLSNLLAAFAIGFIIGAERRAGNLDERLKSFLASGLLGGLSTFSTTSQETVQFLDKGSFLAAGLNHSANLVLSLGLVFAGAALGGAIFREA